MFMMTTLWPRHFGQSTETRFRGGRSPARRPPGASSTRRNERTSSDFGRRSRDVCNAETARLMRLCAPTHPVIRADLHTKREPVVRHPGGRDKSRSRLTTSCTKPPQPHRTRTQGSDVAAISVTCANNSSRCRRPASILPAKRCDRFPADLAFMRQGSYSGPSLTERIRWPLQIVTRRSDFCEPYSSRRTGSPSS